MAILPNKGPYHPDNENLPDPGEGMVLNAFPWDDKYMTDPFWWDTLGRTPIEQQKILTVPRSDEERVEMVRRALEESEQRSREADTDNEHDPSPEELRERESRRLWSIALEVAIKGSGAVMMYLIHDKGLRAYSDPEQLMDGYVELQIAAFHGHLDVVEILVEEAAVEIDPKDGEQSALSRAVTGGNLEVVDWLLERGAWWRSPEEANEIFTGAAATGKVVIMKLLLRTAIDNEPFKNASDFIKGRVLAGAAQSCSEEMVKFVLERGEYKKAVENTEEQRKDAIVAIPTSIRNDEPNLTILDIVIDCAIPRDISGAFIKSDDEYLVDNLCQAVINCTIRVKLQEMKRLLNLILEATTLTRDSPRFKCMLDHAIRGCYDPKSESTARELLVNWEASPNVNFAEESGGHYPLPLAPGAVSRGNVEWVKFWLDHGADIHLAHGPYCNGPTALAFAVTCLEADVVRSLLEYGGPVDKIEQDLVGKKEINVVVYGSEQNSVELTTASPVDEAEEAGLRNDRKFVTLEFEDGISEEWIKNIQLRRPDTELALDGTGRPRKGRHA